MSQLQQLSIPGDPDWDAASDAVSAAYFPHVLRPRVARSTATEADVAVTVLGPLRIARIGWGAEVSIHSDHPGAYGINVPLNGVLETSVAGHSVVSTSGSATVNPPDTPTDITRWSSTCTIVGVKIDRDFLHHEMCRVTGQPDTSIPDQLDLRSPEGASWFRLVQSIAGQPADDPLLANPLVAEQLAGSLTDAFLLAAVPDDRGDHLLPRPRIVTRVLDALRADPARPWTAADMAESAGVSVRRLQEGFRQYVGKTPRECLTEIRLAAVHDDLMRGTSASVTDAAMKAGFTHTGRFAAAFRQRYGVSPSQLLTDR
ncbi:AraC family transcriptional regulator [Gordonia sp. Z-3]|jgi:AraC-like DNA-binding protein|uniref:AraC family transcriptional regulator n=2 Tax=Gordonia TaxID=2053 RepID=A0A9X3D4P5_9ACTN|nr:MULTISPECIES: AraC family transcriptional regulator [Gordonia]MCF3939142.1 AraC family transcriptional regulator [Gordonia tangerina]MCX2964955.1 AraC family transcriptional regulator [Gordonia aquimaris]MED5801350.1 AraC family transcriptional regulator [Gordonia sp. Z-3]